MQYRQQEIRSPGLRRNSDRESYRLGLVAKAFDLSLSRPSRKSSNDPTLRRRSHLRLQLTTMARSSLPRALLARHVRVGRTGLVPPRLGPATLSFTSPSSCGLSTASGSASLHSASSNPSSSSSSSSSFTTVNADEISHFSRLSSQWWSETGEFALLHRMNPARVSYIREKVALDTSGEDPWTFEARHTDGVREKARGVGQWLKGKRCLDVGCGGGLLSETLARLGGDVVGVDASKENIGIAKTHAGQDPFLPLIKDVDGDDGEIRSNTRTPVRGTVGSLEYRHTSAELLRDAGEKFDVVCAMEVLEHVDEPGEFMKCLGEMVKVGPARVKPASI
jgi:polyprenyldihydroxybenzoate methyltransferase/3-demethylubiquinol 3-O-methyltransferase